MIDHDSLSAAIERRDVPRLIEHIQTVRRIRIERDRERGALCRHFQVDPASVQGLIQQIYQTRRDEIEPIIGMFIELIPTLKPDGVAITD